MAKLIMKYMDRDCFAVVEGDRHCTDALLKQKFDLIFFTGSGFVGKIVAKAAAEAVTWGATIDRISDFTLARRVAAELGLPSQ